MRLISLDFDPVYGDDVDRASFSGDLSVFDYDVVIWDPAASLRAYDAYGGLFQNLPEISAHQSVQIKSDARRRHNEFTEFVNSGRVLVVVARPPQECYIDTGEKRFSGTGRNQKTTRLLSKFDLLSALPVPGDTQFIPASGSRIELDGDGPFQRMLRKYKDRLEYEAVIKNPPGTPLAHVTGTKRQLASIQRSQGGGYLIFLPPVDLQRDISEDEELDEDDHGWAEDAHEFQSDLLDAIEHLNGGKVTTRPAWAANYATKRQQELNAAVIEQQAKIEVAREKHAKLKQEKKESEARDQLFLGTGRALELEVRAVLELLGGVVTESEPDRDDWKVEFTEGKAVVEVKGVGKSAAEKYAAQLEKWVATEMEETGTAPKGILVVNSWREIPLEDRTSADFPDQMLPYAKSRKHCMITGLQLFVIREEIETNVDRAEYWRKKIMKTSGVLAGAKDWAKTIKKTESAE